MKQKKINTPKNHNITKSFSEKIAGDLKVCEDNVKHFPSDNKFASGITRCLERIQEILRSKDKRPNATLRHDIKKPSWRSIGLCRHVQNESGNRRR